MKSLLTSCATRLRRIALWPLTMAAVVTLVPSPALGAEGGIYPGDLGQAIAAWLIFGLLLAVLGRWAWKPIVTQLRQREEYFTRSLDDARKANEEAQDLLAQYKARLERAEADAKELLSKSMIEAAKAKEQVLTQARTEAHKSIQTAAHEIDRAKKNALEDLCGRAADLVTAIAGKLIRKNLQPQDHQELLKESLDKIRQDSGRS